MSTVSVTYKAPKGDSKVCELFGYTFFDGKPVEIEENEANAHALKKLANNSLFETSGGTSAATAGQREAAATGPEPEDEDDDDKAKKKKGRF